MIRYKVNCKVCQECRKDPKFRLRVYNAAFKRQDGDETMQDIANAYIGKMTRAALYNHVKKHQTYTAPTREAQVVTRIERNKAQIAKEMELAVDHDDILPTKDYEKVWELVISEGMKELKTDGMKLSVNSLLSATKLKSEYDMKKRGQDADIIKMMMRAASGAPEEDNSNKQDGQTETRPPGTLPQGA